MGLDNREMLVAHLGMSGQLLSAKGPKEPKAHHTHAVIIHLGRSVALRRTTHVRCAVRDGGAGQAEGPCRSSPTWDSTLSRTDELEEVRVAAGPPQSGLKPLPMDQHFVAGIGNMYAEGSCSPPGFVPTVSGTLTAQEVRRLYRSMVETWPRRSSDMGIVVGRRTVPGPLRRHRGLPGLAPGLRPGGRGVPPLPFDHCPGEIGRPVDIFLRPLPGLTRPPRVPTNFTCPPGHPQAAQRPIG